jgi:hypothetical protein
LRGIPFSELIFDTTGKKLLPLDATNAVDQRVAKAIGTACDETMTRLNAPDSVIQNIDRINEVSGHFENTLRELLNATAGLQCDFVVIAEGKLQRSGYPDLSITDLQSKRVFYLDSKLYAAGSRDSSFRTLYSNQRGRRTKCGMTRCISSLDLNMRRVKPDRVRRTRGIGFSQDDMEIRAMGSCRPFTVHRQTESRNPRKQSRHVPARGNCRLKREMTACGRNVR